MKKYDHMPCASFFAITDSLSSTGAGLLPLESAKGKKSLAVGDIRARRNPLNCKIKKFALNERGKGETFPVTLTQETCTQRDYMTLLVFFISWCIHIFFLLFYCVELNFYNLGGIRHGTPLIWICASLNVTIKLIYIWGIIQIIRLFYGKLCMKYFFCEGGILCLLLVPQFILIMPFDCEWMSNAIFRFIPKL